MAAQGDTLPAAAPAEALDEAGKWFWNFLKLELTPYPGRASVVARMTIASSIVMLVVMTFRLPDGFLAAIYTLFLSRESPAATLRAGVRTIVVFAIATVYTMVSLTAMVDDPLTHFLWVMVTLFLAFYLIRIVQDYVSAVAFGFMVAGAIPLWDETSLSVNTRVENTLWLAFAVLLGAGVTIAVEYVFRHVHPTTDLAEGIETRLQAVEDILRTSASGLPPGAKSEKNILLFSSVGTSRLQRLLVRSGYNTRFISQMSAVLSLLRHLVDLAANLQILRTTQKIVFGPEDRERCRQLAEKIATLRQEFAEGRLPGTLALPSDEIAPAVPFLHSMERAVAMIPLAFSNPEWSHDLPIPAAAEEEKKQPLFVHDAFTNPSHIYFALSGMTAATACYAIYLAIDWPGLSTSIATCIITALSTIGSSRQKQFLRLGGALIGGIIFGMGAQVFVLPYIDSIAGFALLYAVVTAISGWIAVASARLSYLGVQLGFSFYLINMQEFAIQTSLGVARDRVFGVLLGLMAMWVVFDHAGSHDALSEMQSAFAKNLEMFAQLSDQLLEPDVNQAATRIRKLRDRIDAGFEVVRTQSGAIPFEFGSSRERKLKARGDLMRWQPMFRALLQVQVTFSQYSLQERTRQLPGRIAQPLAQFEAETAAMARSMAAEVSGQDAKPAPDIRGAAAAIERQIHADFEGRGLALSPRASDMITLTQTLASILTSLQEDIHSTCANPHESLHGLPRGRLSEG